MKNFKKNTSQVKSYNSNSVRGFGVNKDKIIWDSGDVIQWLISKSVLIDKFKSEGIYNRISGDAEIVFNKLQPVEDTYINDRINALITDNDNMRDLNIQHNNQMQTAGIIDANEFTKSNLNLERDHQLNNNRINTTERYKLQAEFLKINQEFEKQLNKTLQRLLKSSMSL
jgi:hypothetical protein